MMSFTRIFSSRLRANLFSSVKQVCPPTLVSPSIFPGLSLFMKCSTRPHQKHLMPRAIHSKSVNVPASILSSGAAHLQCHAMPSLLRIPWRGVVNFSKRRGKKKTVKAVAKRFHRTGSGKLKYWPAGKVHNMLAKSRNHRQRLRKPRYANKTQLKTLNKMLSGW